MEMKRCTNCGCIAFEKDDKCKECGGGSFCLLEEGEITLKDAIRYVTRIEGGYPYDEGKCLSILSDVVPGLKQERIMLETAFRCGAVASLRNGVSGVGEAIRQMEGAGMSESATAVILEAYGYTLPTPKPTPTPVPPAPQPRPVPVPSPPQSKPSPPTSQTPSRVPYIALIMCLVIVAVAALAYTTNGLGHSEQDNNSSGLSVGVREAEESTDDAVAYQISFDGGGATQGSMDSLYYESGSTAKVPECGFTYGGHEFSHWESTQGVAYEPGQTITLTSELELVAVWETKTYTTRFLGGGANGGSVSDIKAEYGETITLPTCGYYRDGYEFDYWEADSGFTYRVGESFYVKGDATFTAQWVQRPSASASSSSSTSSSSSANNEQRYELVKKDISWSDAKAACEAKGGHLVTITSQQEMDTIVSMARNAGLEFVWLGGTTSGGTNGQWITGESFSYSAWCENEPSHKDLDGTLEDCIELWHFKSTDEWTWNDERNNPLENPDSADAMSGSMGYVCEYES